MKCDAKDVFRLLGLLGKFRGQVVLSILFGFATITSGIGLMGTSAWLISRAALQPSIAVLQVSIVGVRFFGISRGVFRYLERLTSHDVNLRLLSGLRRRVYDTLERIWPAAVLQFDSGDLLSRATADVDLLENFFVRVVSPVVTAGLVTVGMGLFTGRFSTQLAWVLVSGLLANGLLVPLISRLASRKSRTTLPALRGQLSAAISQNIQGQRDLLVYGMQANRLDQFKKLQQQFETTQINLARREGLSEALNTLLPNLTAFLVLIVAIPLVVNGQLEGVLLAVVVLLALASFEAVAPLGLATQNLDLSLQASNRLFSLETIPPAVQDPTDALPLPSGSVSITVSHLDFEYPSEDTEVLQDISFELSPGKQLAIVGPSGAGKSTLINLLLRLWDAPPGTIFLGGEDIHQYQTTDVRHLFSTVSQRGWLFGRTLRQNLLIAQPDAEDGQLIRALEQAQLGEWLDTLPDGLNTWLGEGLKISGGEKQRLMIARALLQNRPIWLLDEPTVHLDPAGEQQVLDMLEKTLKGRSTVWIMHNLVRMENMGEILVLREGRVIERGTHASLMELDGYYRFLHDTSAGR
ncbi:MAG: thiol reductant ABC exporter subunit CydC [Chloroflexi bacterium]|nr:thiol reductant ABC exporter subunit CydC [Chloroflexota bacterium]